MLDFIFTEATLRLFMELGSKAPSEIFAHASDIGNPATVAPAPRP